MGVGRVRRVVHAPPTRALAGRRRHVRGDVRAGRSHRGAPRTGLLGTPGRADLGAGPRGARHRGRALGRRGDTRPAALRGRRIRHARALVLVTYRDEGLAADDALRVAVGELSSQRSTRRIRLPRLSVDAVAELAATSTSTPARCTGSPTATPSMSRRCCRLRRRISRARSGTRCSRGSQDSARTRAALSTPPR